MFYSWYMGLESFYGRRDKLENLSGLGLKIGEKAVRIQL